MPTKRLHAVLCSIHQCTCADSRFSYPCQQLSSSQAILRLWGGIWMFCIYLLVQTYSGVTQKPLPGECVAETHLFLCCSAAACRCTPPPWCTPFSWGNDEYWEKRGDGDERKCKRGPITVRVSLLGARSENDAAEIEIAAAGVRRWQMKFMKMSRFLIRPW